MTTLHDGVSAPATITATSHIAVATVLPLLRLCFIGLNRLLMIAPHLIASIVDNDHVTVAMIATKHFRAVRPT